mgnify:FL=1
MTEIKTKLGWGGRRPGSGRKKKQPPSSADLELRRAIAVGRKEMALTKRLMKRLQTEVKREINAEIKRTGSAAQDPIDGQAWRDPKGGGARRNAGRKNTRRVCEGCGRRHGLPGVLPRQRPDLCRDCYRSAKPSPGPSKSRVRQLKRYGLSVAAFLEMVASQQSRCAICLTTHSQADLHVDHCHATGTVRGLLCSFCNTGLGLFRDNPEALRMAVRYLTATNRLIGGLLWEE